MDWLFEKNVEKKTGVGGEKGKGETVDSLFGFDFMSSAQEKLELNRKRSLSTYNKEEADEEGMEQFKEALIHYLKKLHMLHLTVSFIMIYTILYYILRINIGE